MKTKTLRVLVYPSDGFVVGHCIDHSLCVRSNTIEGVAPTLRRSIELLAEAGNDFFSYPPAPQDLLDTWSAIHEPPKRVRVDSQTFDVEIVSKVLDVAA